MAATAKMMQKGASLVGKVQKEVAGDLIVVIRVYIVFSSQREPRNARASV